MSTAVRIAELEQQNSQLSEQLAVLKRQLDWFKRQLFGAKSEKQWLIDPAVQGNLLVALGVATPPPPQSTPTTTVTYTRKKLRDNAVTDSGLRFDETVPVNTIVIGDPAIEALPESARECIGEKVTYRLAQRPASYEVLKYVRRVYKILATQEVVTTTSPATVLERCVADVSLLGGLLTDKFLYHLPLYRQHQRLSAAGIQVSRGSLMNWSSRAIDLLEPIYAAQFSHVLLSRVLAMDETPIKAGRREKGKLRQGYFWPIYGEDNEVVFPFATSRSHSQVQTFLGSFTGTLLSDGYEAYAAYARNNAEVTHAECWAHCRRHFEGAKEAEPTAVAEALTLIGRLYRHEESIRDNNLDGEQKLAYRTAHSEPIAQTFWHWCDEQCHRPDLVPSNPRSQGIEVCARASRQPAGVPHGSRGAGRHQSSRAGTARHSHGAAQLAVLLDRAWRQTGRHHSEPDRDLQAARRRCLHVPGRCAAACEPASREGRHRSHATRVENEVRPRSHEIRCGARGSITVWFVRLRFAMIHGDPGSGTKSRRL